MKMASSSAFCARSAGITRDRAASTASLGTARAGPPDRPNMAAPNGCRGTATMS